MKSSLALAKEKMDLWGTLTGCLQMDSAKFDQKFRKIVKMLSFAKAATIELIEWMVSFACLRTWNYTTALYSTRVGFRWEEP